MLCLLHTVFVLLVLGAPFTQAEETPAPKADTPPTLVTPVTPATPATPATPGADAKPAENVIKFSKDLDAPPPEDIFAAAKGGDLEAVKQFVERDANLIQARTKLMDTALHWASSCNHTDIVKYLLSKGSDPNAKNISGATPLHLAARKAYVGPMEALIFAKAEVNAKNDDGEETPLHIAVYKGNVEAIELLLKNGANPNARMTDGTRPMDIAEKKEKSEVRKLMTKYKGVSNANEEE